ncbi:hypothetical protein BDI4_120066 [Burkholderia diffusa]|nr:hypothetical protein BDI4_120066 [Burkholderia diffusa]
MEGRVVRAVLDRERDGQGRCGAALHAADGAAARGARRESLTIARAPRAGTGIRYRAARIGSLMHVAMSTRVRFAG